VRECVYKFVFESNLRLRVGGLLVRSLPACIHGNAGAGNQIRSKSEFGLITIETTLKRIHSSFQSMLQ